MKKIIKVALWIVVVITAIPVLSVLYFWYPIDHNAVVRSFEEKMSELQKTRVEWYVNSYCELLSYEGKSVVSEEDSENGCGIKGYLETTKHPFTLEDGEIYYEFSEIINGAASIVGLRYNDEGVIEWALFYRTNKLGFKDIYYIFQPGYAPDNISVDYPRYGQRVPLNANWYYIVAE